MSNRVKRVGLSLKMYFDHARAVDFFETIAPLIKNHPAVLSKKVDFFLIPTYLQILPALEIFEGSGVLIGAQDSAIADEGAYTGEVSPKELSEIGAKVTELGHAERRRLFHEDDELVSQKVERAVANSLLPVICIGEVEKQDSKSAAEVTLEQAKASLARAGAGPVVLAYEPVWAIGASQPAPIEHILHVTKTLQNWIDQNPQRDGSSVIYGGSAGPGLLTELAEGVDGLFLGRFAHDPLELIKVLDEAEKLWIH